MRTLAKTFRSNAFKPVAHMSKYHCCAAFGIIFGMNAASVMANYVLIAPKQAASNVVWPFLGRCGIYVWLYGSEFIFNRRFKRNFRRPHPYQFKTAFTAHLASFYSHVILFSFLMLSNYLENTHGSKYSFMPLASCMQPGSLPIMLALFAGV